MLPRRMRAPVPTLLRSRVPTVYASRACTVRAKENGMGYNRFGVVIGTAAEPRAVKRHAVKRIALGAARGWPASPSYDVVFFFMRPAAQLSRQGLRDEIAKVREKIFT